MSNYSQPTITQKAEQLLANCESVQLASINNDGYPRICEMERVKSVGLSEIYFTTLKRSAKVAHFIANNKAGVSCSIDYDSVSLVGIIEVIENMSIKKQIWQGEHERRFENDDFGNPKYCILKFTAFEATLFIDGEKHYIKPI